MIMEHPPISMTSWALAALLGAQVAAVSDQKQKFFHFQPHKGKVSPSQTVPLSCVPRRVIINSSRFRNKRNYSGKGLAFAD